MQYQLGSGTRPGNTAPGLCEQRCLCLPPLSLSDSALLPDGPWQTVEIQGFGGDYTAE